jgi:membrane-bound ClpP family serine protease
MKKVIGYAVSIVGIAVMALGFGLINIDLKPLGIPANYIAVAGIITIIIGVVLALKNGQSKNSKDEVPIYEGTGKKRKIVGYRKD